ncbi:MAG: cytochrome C oxidase subunit IV family protein [Rhodocyclaceae bacterium]|jgi:stage V sporulation protein SpoVS|nr:cytochrome C oxidase subunit IV family protein [Rhodocyclaceae bacterium]
MNGQYSSRGLDFVWVLLLAGTGFTWWLGESGHAGPQAVTAILAIAAVKGVLVIREFMALRGVSLLWQATVIGWLVVALAANMAAYWKGL